VGGFAVTLEEWLACDLDELCHLARRIDPRQAASFCDLLLDSHRVFVTGKGRTGLAMEMFAMRLMQLGLEAFVVGEATTPAIGPGDTLVAASGSGETAGVLAVATRARQAGARIAVVTAQPASSLGRMADHLLFLPGETTKVNLEQSSRLPLGSVLEQALLVLVDSVSAHLAERMGRTNASMMARHANLE
jgi:6-phospho-3-hexuloisomerase